MIADPIADIRTILAEGQDMSLATLRPDGWPQATVVSYVADGADIYFGCAAQSQKACNLARDNRVSATITLPYRDWAEIRGLALAGFAERLETVAARAGAGALFTARFPQLSGFVDADSPDLALFRIRLEVVSLLDYREGFGHHHLIGRDELAG